MLSCFAGRKFQKHCFYYALGILTVASLMGVMPLSAGIAAEELPPEIQPCTKKLGTVYFFAKQRVKQTQTTYYLLKTDKPNQDYYHAPVVSLRDGACQLLTPRQNGSPVPLTSVMDPAIAQKLMVDAFEKIIKEAGGIEAFERGFMEEFKKNNKPLLMPSESYYALQKLGVKLPANIQPFDGMTTPDGSQASQ
jgi:hypothetical protein